MLIPTPRAAAAASRSSSVVGVAGVAGSDIPGAMFDPAVFAARREAFMTAIGPDAVAVVSSLPERLRNGDAMHPFRQHSDLYYLTGFVEPDTTLVLRPGAGTDRTVMFVRPRDPEMETWDGRRAGLEGAKARYGADVAYPVAELELRLWDLLANHDELHFALGLDERMDLRITAAIARLRRTEKKGRRPPRAVVDPRLTLHELRLHKRPEELAALRTACAITADAHVAAMKRGRPGTFEYQLEATLDYTFRSRGGSGPGYASIVGAGDNATILHYIENRCEIMDGDLVLIDAGCEYDHYTGDISRTWPASGTFSAAQRDVYDRVLATQEAAIAMVKPGVTIDEIHTFCVRALTTAMIDLGLLAGTVDERIADGSYRRFYMHGTSHWLGLDVHDAGAYTRGGKARPLQPGMVITIEPGLYIPLHAVEVPERLRGIGVRIEDNILVTDDGHENLTIACPKDVATIEALCR
ncbi:MAG: aminopeptidase P N-terminal domain-containing protein [Proteobacteria bacterium]|nr:aminopeptidase P N-terminal domain-containing protein [Pseudomonadota bacterium]